MDRLGGTDTRIADLSTEGPEAARYALVIALTQRDTLRHRGHMLALNDEFVWRKLKKHRGRTLLPTIMVRCVFCGAVVSLADWYRASGLPLEQAEYMRYRLNFDHRTGDLAFLSRCDGDSRADRLLMTLMELAGWDMPIVEHAEVDIV